MKDNSYKEAILMAAMEYGYLNTHAISVLRDHQKYLQQQTHTLTKDGFLTDRKFKCKIKNREYTVRYKTITQKGIEFVLKNWSDKYTWLAYLPIPLPDYHIIPYNNMDMLYRRLLSITASMLFKEIGIKSVISIGSDSRDGLSFEELIYSAKSQDKTENGTIETLSINEVSNNYIHGREIYPLFQAEQDEKQQLLFTQQIGFLLNRSKSYIIYSAKKNGINVSYTMLERVRVQFRKYLREYNISTETRVLNDGIILAETPTAWKNTFLGNTNIKNKKKIDMYIDRLLVLPVRRELVYILDKILYYGDDFEQIVTGILQKTDNNFEWYGGLKYKGQDVIIGIDMDLVKLQKLYVKLRSKDSDSDGYIIVCVPWQEEYYKMIFPDNVRYYHIYEDSLIPDEYCEAM